MSAVERMLQGQGPLRAEQGLRAFFDEARAAPGETLAPPEGLTASLDDWLEKDETPCALLTGPAGKMSTLLARWALDVAARERFDVVLLPIGRRLRTALERDAFGLLEDRVSVLLRSVTPAGTPDQYRQDLAAMLRKGRRTGKFPPWGDLPILIILQGVEEAVDFGVDSLSFLTELGPEIRVVVAVEAAGGDASSWCARLGWDLQATTALHLEPGPPPGLRGQLPEGDARAQALLRALASAFGPIGERDLATLLTAREEVPSNEAEIASTLARLEPLIARDSEGYSLRDPGLARQITEAMEAGERAAWAQRFAAHGRAALAALREGRAGPADVSTYVVEYHRAHLEHAGADLDAFLELVSPEWRDAWARYDHAFGGLFSDLRRVRGRITEALRAAPDRATRVPMLRALARCALVEASVFTIAFLTRKARGEDESGIPRGHNPLDFTLVIGDGPTRAAVLRAIAAMLSDARSETVLAWVQDASSDPAPPMPVLPRSTLPPEKEIAEALRMLEDGRPQYAFSALACADAMDDADVDRIFFPLLDYLVQGSHMYRREDFLRQWDRKDFLHLLPLFARLGGEDALFAVAEELRQVATWFP